MTAAYPLTWPDHIERTRIREAGRFKSTLAGSLRNVEDSLRRFGTDSKKAVKGLVISSNVTLGANKPEDPGVAIWFTWDDMPVCIPVDRYTTVEGNLQAIHHVIEARRTELRHGTLALLRATFKGFLALPAPPGSPAKRAWREVLGFAEQQNPSKSSIENAYREAAKKAHPDAGGSNAAMSELHHAKIQALKEIGA